MNDFWLFAQGYNAFVKCDTFDGCEGLEIL